MYHPIKFGCKKISSLSDEMSPYCGPKLEDSKPIFLTDNLAHNYHLCITIPSLVVKGSAVQKILSGQTFTNILMFCCDLDLEHSNAISSLVTLAYNNVPPKKTPSLVAKGSAVQKI